MIINTKRRRQAQSGYLAVETAIFLPIFLIGLLTFAYLIKYLLIEEAIFHAFADETRILCAEAGFNPANALQFESQIEKRIYEETGRNVSSVEIEHFLYLYPANGMTGMISMDLNYDVEIRLPIQIIKNLPVAESLMCRGFVGKKESMKPLGFDELEKVNDSDPVWIFPRAGGKYHSENCICIKSEPFQTILSYKIKKTYEPCSICDSKNLANGSLVYCFKTGKSYHSANCPLVDKYIISIEKNEAVEKGYSACQKCGGE